MKKICMIVQDKMVKGGIAAVVSAYYGSCLEKDYKITYVESYCDGGKRAKLVRALSGYLRFAKILLTDRPDLVHIHSSFGPSFYRKIPFICMASLAGIPIVNHIHGADFETFYLKAGNWKRNLIAAVYGKCDYLIALSGEWKERLAQIVPSDRIVVIRNYGVLHEDAQDARRERHQRANSFISGDSAILGTPAVLNGPNGRISSESPEIPASGQICPPSGEDVDYETDPSLSMDRTLSPDSIRILMEDPVLPGDCVTSEDRVTSGDKNCSHAPTVLFLGELGQRKGCYDIPAVAERVLQVIPQARFVLCGAGSPDEETAIRQLFSERHLSDRVEFPGWVRNDEKDRRLRQADVFFLPSYQEGLPMSILDAMGYGLPVVSTKVGGIPELVQDRVNGRLCAPGDIDAMADALIELLQDDSLRLQYGEASLTLVRTEFSLDVHLQALENLWEKALTPTASQTAP